MAALDAAAETAACGLTVLCDPDSKVSGLSGPEARARAASMRRHPAGHLRPRLAPPSAVTSLVPVAER